MKRLFVSSDFLVKASKIQGFVLIAVLSILISSCVSQRDLEYFKMNKKTPASFNEPDFSDYLLKPSDALYIKISSLDDVSSNVFAESTGQSGALDPYSAYLNSFTIDQEGKIDLPVIGKIKVEGKTTQEVGYIIKDSVENILSLPMVTVKLVNQYVSVVGEIELPGHYVYSQDKFTIFNAISMAGDITSYGNRKEVYLTRIENGKSISVKLDLTNPEILSSEYFYIKPNDLIYVKPMRKRFWGIEQFDFTLVFSIITTGLLIYTIIEQP
ncbi:MAG: polysaccharide export protein [Bacteroidales bacterium]|nr:polysaccharide export protein [Bacteroidales bacterium]